MVRSIEEILKDIIYAQGDPDPTRRERRLKELKKELEKAKAEAKQKEEREKAEQKRLEEKIAQGPRKGWPWSRKDDGGPGRAPQLLAHNNKKANQQSPDKVEKKVRFADEPKLEFWKSAGWTHAQRRLNLARENHERTAAASRNDLGNERKSNAYMDAFQEVGEATQALTDIEATLCREHKERMERKAKEEEEAKKADKAKKGEKDKKSKRR